MLTGQPQIQSRAKIMASKTTTSEDDLYSNLLGGHERVEVCGLEPETLNVDIVTHASKFLQNKAGGTQ